MTDPGKRHATSDEGVRSDAARTLERSAKGGRPVWGAVIGLLALAGITIVAVATQMDRGVSRDGQAEPVDGRPPPAAGMPVSFDFDYLVDSLEALLAATPDDTVALARMVDLMLAAHQPERAVELTGQWLDANPGSTQAWLMRVMGFAALEQWDAALDANQTLLRLEPSWMLAQLNMGSIHGNRGEFEEARRWWTGIIDAAPGTPEAEAAQRALDSVDPSPN